MTFASARSLSSSALPFSLPRALLSLPASGDAIHDVWVWQIKDLDAASFAELLPPELIELVKKRWISTADRMKKHLTDQYLPKALEAERDGRSEIERMARTPPQRTMTKKEMDDLLNPQPLAILHEYRDMEMRAQTNLEHPSEKTTPLMRENSKEKVDDSRVIQKIIDKARTRFKDKFEWTLREEDKGNTNFDMTFDDLIACPVMPQFIAMTLVVRKRIKSGAKEWIGYQPPYGN